MKLQDYYEEGERISIETDLGIIKEKLSSSASACWGQHEIPNTGYYQLLVGSPQYKGGKVFVLVCSMIDFNKVKNEICLNCSKISSGLQWINHQYNHCQHKANNYKDNDNMFTSKHRMEEKIVLEQGGCSNFEHKKYGTYI